MDSFIPVEDIADCCECRAFGEPCPYHVGFADGWDSASAIVGRFVTLVPKETHS